MKKLILLVIGIFLLSAFYFTSNAISVLDLETEGQKLWKSKDLGTTGMTCYTCHPNGKSLNFKPYPKYITMAKRKMAVLEDMINFCIKTPLKGKALKHDSKEMKALVAYYNKLGRK